MSKEQALIHYRAAMAVVNKWLERGFITEGELQIVEAVFADKYGLPSSSIYRQEACYYGAFE